MNDTNDVCGNNVKLSVNKRRWFRTSNSTMAYLHFSLLPLLLCGNSPSARVFGKSSSSSSTTKKRADVLILWDCGRSHIARKHGHRDGSVIVYRRKANIQFSPKR